VPLHATALSYGLVGSVYWAFAGDAVAGALGGGAAAAALFWTLMGAAGIAAVRTGRLIGTLGLRGAHTLLVAAFAAAVALLGVLPGSLAAVAASAVVYGASFMALSGLLAVWSHRVFPERPAAGFSAVVFALGIGTVAGPALMGVLADRAGTGAAFLAAGAVAAATLVARPVVAADGRAGART
jgi:predicted MFS family arabinose efflux permease